MTRPEFTRRGFIAASGALVVSARIPVRAQLPGSEKLPVSLRNEPFIDAWVRIASDDSITIFTGKAEIGQGIKTALIQIAAEELDVAPEAITLVTADTERTPNEGFTAGSVSIEQGGMAIRHAAAEARQILLKQAAEHLGMPSSELIVEDGRISGGDTTVTFGSLVDGWSLHREASGNAPVKNPAAHRVVGTSLPRVDLPAKIFGGRAYVQDLRLDGMAHARMVHPPAPGKRLEHVDPVRTEALPGVISVVRDGSFLGVIAEREEQAIAAAETLRADATWEGEGPDLPADDADLEAYLRGFKAETTVLVDRGAPKRNGHTLRSGYVRPFQAHASMGPSCAVAHMRDGQLTVWSHTQGAYPLRREIAKVLRMPQEAVHVIHAEGAGCYGHNGADDAGLEAALLARAAPGRPVRLQWMREDEFAWEPLGTAMIMDCAAALDSEGLIDSWQYSVRGFTHVAREGFGEGSNLFAAQLIADSLPVGPAMNIPLPSGGLDRNAVPPYVLSKARIVEHYIPDRPVRVSALRGLGAYGNVFAIESFFDELAHVAETDPLEFRLLHLRDERARAVIRKAADMADWYRNLPEGDGLGIGFAQYKNHATYCAVIAHVRIDAASGVIRVPQLWAAADCGQAINPDGVKNQIEGGAMQSTSWTLKEAVSFSGSARRVSDFADYPLLTATEAPMIEVALIDRPTEPPVGTGEAAQGPTAAAIGNAVYAASGVRLRRLPFTPAVVKAALAS